MVAQVNFSYVRMRPTRLWARLISYLLFEGRPLTTRGRWINLVVFGLSGLLKKLPCLKQVVKPVFILGTGRSGTTILGIVLSMHRDVGFLNEPKAIWAAIHPDEDLIGNYSRDPASYRLSTDDANGLMVKIAKKIYGGYLRISGTQRVVDKYPELIFRTGFVRALFPDAKFIFLSRNGADTCGSIEKWSHLHGSTVGEEIHDWWGADGRKWKYLYEQIIPEHPDLAVHASDMPGLQHSARAAVEWIVSMREGMKLLSNSPECTLHIPYEQLCESPVEWARRLESYLELSHDQTFINYAECTLTRSNRNPELNLPGWLQEIFSSTQVELDRIS